MASVVAAASSSAGVSCAHSGAYRASDASVGRSAGVVRVTSRRSAVHSAEWWTKLLLVLDVIRVLVLLILCW